MIYLSQTFITSNLPDTSKSRILPTLLCSKETLQFVIKFNFQFYDITDTEYVTLCNLLVKHKNCYTTHQNDVGRIATSLRIRLKSNAQISTQRPSEVPNHYKDKLEKHNIIKHIASFPEDNSNYGTFYLHPLIIIPRGDSIKCVLDGRHLN